VVLEIRPATAKSWEGNGGLRKAFWRQLAGFSTTTKVRYTSSGDAAA
jgi:hypothetical protein